MDEKKIDYIISKVDLMAIDITAIKVLDATQNEQLANHIRRTALLEKRVEQVDAELKPIRSYFSSIHVIMGLVGALGLVLGLIETLKRLL